MNGFFLDQLCSVVERKSARSLTATYGRKRMGKSAELHQGSLKFFERKFIQREILKAIFIPSLPVINPFYGNEKRAKCLASVFYYIVLNCLENEQ